jgi:hypothetical protein
MMSVEQTDRNGNCDSYNHYTNDENQELLLAHVLSVLLAMILMNCNLTLPALFATHVPWRCVVPHKKRDENERISPGATLLAFSTHSLGNFYL